MSGYMTPPLTPVKKDGVFGYCYASLFGENADAAARTLGCLPTLQEVVDYSIDQSCDSSDFGPWSYNLDGNTVTHGFSGEVSTAKLEPVVCDGRVVAYHASDRGGTTTAFYNQLSKAVKELRVGVDFADLVKRCGDCVGSAETYVVSALEVTTAMPGDAEANYLALGDLFEAMRSGSHAAAGIARSRFTELTHAVVSRWAGDREATAVAKLAACLVYNSEAEPWSVDLLEEAMEPGMSESEKQVSLLRIAGMVFYKRAAEVLHPDDRRAGLAPWKCDLAAPAKVFTQPVGVDSEDVARFLSENLANAQGTAKWALNVLAEHASGPLEIMGKVAAGTAVAATLVAAAGLALDWYYDSKSEKQLGRPRRTISPCFGRANHVERAKELLAIGGALSDDTYDTQTHTQVIRLDPFFFSVRGDVSRLKDDSAAHRMLTNTVLPPLLQNITTANKTIINLPGTISEESAQHIQSAMPEFYFRIVNRSHSHPELWAVRRAFELMISRALVNVDGCKRAFMVGGNVRQVSKIPGVCLNYGPTISGRDEARHRLKGSANQRRFYRQVNLDQKFGATPKSLQGMVGVALYATQDMTKQAFVAAMIKSSVTTAMVAVNIPIVMMDSRIKSWDDMVLNCRYVRRGRTLSMAPMGMPVAGYNNDFSATMSWAKPVRPFLGYDVTCEVVACVGSSYLMSIDIGVGPQEAHDTIWKMPDAGYYVLHDLTRVDGRMEYFTVPAQKFDQVVKFVIQLNGAKNVVEATAGRMLGLEAQIKIGGVVLERAWNMTYQEFSSVVIHAVVCSGVAKGDMLNMLSSLRRHFECLEDKTLGQRIVFGFSKLLGLDSDHRRVPILRRGANDYMAVRHWTMTQLSGEGFAAALDCGISDDQGVPIAQGSVKRVEPSSVVVDEGYCSIEELNEGEFSDSGSEKSNEAVETTVLDKMTKWLRPVDDVKEKRGEEFEGFGTDSMTRHLMVDVDEMNSMQTDSVFDPSAYLSFESTGSKSQMRFSALVASVEDLKAALSNNDKIYCPDRGAMHVVLESLALPRRSRVGFVSLHRHVANGETDTPMGRLESAFHGEVGDAEELASPQLLLDGLAGSAKSSVVAAALRERAIACAIVCPTRRLAKEWRARHLGTVVTKHKLMLNTLRGRAVLVVDEVFAYSKSELFGLLWKANAMGVKVILLGDRRQQYEDGGELTYNDVEMLNQPVLRLCVTNTMPVDALKIAKWAAGEDPDVDLFQTRNKIVHSIKVIQRDQTEHLEILNRAVKSDDCLVYKDRAGPELHYSGVTDSELGFTPGQEDEWLSVSRVQGVRTKHAMLLTSRFTKSERWFAEQRGLLYVATSRHSKSMLWTAEQSDLSLLGGLVFDTIVSVEGRLAMLQARERFDAPMLVVEASTPKKSPLLQKLQERGMLPQTVKFRTAGALREDWRPWHKFSRFDEGSAAKVMEATTMRLAGPQMPYVFTDSARLPIYTSAMGLYSMRRPAIRDADEVDAKFSGMNRLAVLQNSRDEHLDLKNVIERTARPRKIDKDPYRVRVQSQQLFDLFVKCYLKGEGEEVGLSLSPSAADWADSRTTDFSKKYQDADPYGLTAFSTRSQGFLKTQTKVKLKRSFALEENYGQTVLASPADFNGIFGPWSKMFLRNLRLFTRNGVIMDSGFSDKDLAREFRRLGVMPRFKEENYQADVKRQDTSHTPVTLRVFCLLLEYLGVPKDLADLYEQHSTKYEYHSMHAGLYRGEANFNLGSGDPFTLVRNIVEVLTVMLERYGEQMGDMNMVVKGDDFLSDKIPVLLPVSVQEVRDTQLTEDFNKPPYHAGRFFLEDDVLPDPVRMVTKVLVKRSDSVERVNQLAESFYDKYVHLTELSYSVMREYVVKAYEDFEPEFPLAALDLYHAMRDRTLFFELVGGEMIEESDKLVVVNQAEDCIFHAASWFAEDPAFLDSLRHETRDIVKAKLATRHIPAYDVRGRPNDYLKKGVWLTEDHAWAVIGLTEFNLKTSRED